MEGKKRKDSVKRKTKKHESSYARKSFVKNILYTNNPMQNIVVVSSLLYYKDVLPVNDVPYGDWV